MIYHSLSESFFQISNIRLFFLSDSTTVEELPSENEVLHEDNEWGISLVDEDQPDAQEETSGEISAGVRLAYERKVTKESDVVLTEAQNEESLEDLMNQMKQL